jgi:hypothetical protein
VIAVTVFILLLFALFPVVLFVFVGVLFILFLIGVKFYGFKAFSERSFFNFKVLLAFVNYNPSISGFLKFVVDEKFYFSS